MDKFTSRCPQTITFEEKGKPKRIRTEVLLLTSLTLIETIRQEFNDDPLDTTENFASSVHSSDTLSRFYALSEDQILKLIRESKSTTATVDLAPAKLVFEFTDVLLPVFQKIVNLTFFCLCFRK